jgi:poly(3-hydroxybutyrate) depolymerase
MPQAFDRMRGHGGPTGKALAGLVRAASDHKGPWPTISVWHGSADMTVSPTNADAIVAQWSPLHGLDRAPTWQETVDGYPHRVWCDPAGRPLIEEYSITGMGHGTPLATHGDDAVGEAGAYMLEAGISSTRHIAAFWGLTEAFAGETMPADAAPGVLVPFESATRVRANAVPTPATGVSKVIEDALRAAGLMR